MLAIGGAAGAASFTHVHNVAAAHGQPGWLAWADAIVLELMSIASGLELRRRKRARTSAVFPASVLTCAVALSLAAQVVEAEPSLIGWIAAAVPALGFLVMVKVALGYTNAPSDSSRTGAASPTAHPADQHRAGTPSQDGPDGEAPAVDRTVPTRTVHPPTGDRRPGGPDHRDAGGPGHRHRPPRRRRPAHSSIGVDELLPAARRVRERLATHGRPLTRAALAEALRVAGHTVSNTRASHLLKILKTEQAPAPPARRQDDPGLHPATGTAARHGLSLPRAAGQARDHLPAADHPLPLRGGDRDRLQHPDDRPTS
ncbi:DUF2637 domain-containing protein [Micromonospora sp. RTP1Z1]|uniref:DUF2637 domain-containing protein n=1 Tax=Micromonospora sp. RTP1Z1 TaxID=2994043 RepID=UPI0029C98428|nr:DUF2637 domain-containing protein [Micromonospora sp. RTP1Z1]